MLTPEQRDRFYWRGYDLAHKSLSRIGQKGDEIRQIGDELLFTDQEMQAFMATKEEIDALSERDRKEAWRAFEEGKDKAFQVFIQSVANQAPMPVPQERRARAKGQPKESGTASWPQWVFLGIVVAAILGVGYFFGYHTPIELQVESWQYVNRFTGETLQHEAIDCGWEGYKVEIGPFRYRFECYETFGTNYKPEWSDPKHLSSNTIRTCRRWLKGEGYCDGSGRPLSDSR